jgi:hypothetical protein
MGRRPPHDLTGSRKQGAEGPPRAGIAANEASPYQGRDVEGRRHGQAAQDEYKDMDRAHTCHHLRQNSAATYKSFHKSELRDFRHDMIHGFNLTL